MIIRPVRIKKTGSYLIAAGLPALIPILNSSIYSTISLALSACFLLTAELERARHKYRIDENGLVYEEGLLNKKKVSVNMDNITKLNVKQGIMERIMRYGDVELETYGKPVSMKGIRNPKNNS